MEPAKLVLIHSDQMEMEHVLHVLVELYYVTLLLMLNQSLLVLMEKLKLLKEPLKQISYVQLYHRITNMELLIIILIIK
jgi:hypothetical protein